MAKFKVIFDGEEEDEIFATEEENMHYIYVHVKERGQKHFIGQIQEIMIMMKMSLRVLITKLSRCKC